MTFNYNIKMKTRNLNKVFKIKNFKEIDNSHKSYFIIIKQIIIIVLIILCNKIYYNQNLSNKFNNNEFDDSILIKQIKNDYNNNKFAIIKNKCITCGLFAFYKHYLGCCRLLLSMGYIPIIDLKSFRNIFNGFNKNSLNKNPYEYFFNQPYGFKLEDIQKKGKNIIYYKCDNSYILPYYGIFKNKILIDYWHNIAIKYMPIKAEIIKEADIIKKYLFKNSKNILGILARGTDYLTRRPRSHPVQPKLEVYFNDIKDMDNKNKYDWIFLTTEDELIRLKFIKKYGTKLKFYKKKNHKFKYNYKKREMLCFNKNIKGNIDYMKVYLINIIILSKCLDIITSRTSGAKAAFIFSKGFRNIKVYFFGSYKKYKK